MVRKVAPFNFLHEPFKRIIYLWLSRKTKASHEFYSGNTLVAVINSCVEFKSFHAMMCDARAGELVWGMPPLQDEKTGELFA